MKNYVILAKDGIYVAVDILSDAASHEIISLKEQGFIVAFDSCRAESIEHALKVWQSQREGTFSFEHILTSTTNSLAKNIDVIEGKGVITATIVAGTNIFRDIFASVRDIVGGNSSTYMSKLDDIKSQALVQLKKQADELDCNAIIGVSIDVDEVSGGGKSMLMVTASGTAVIVERST
ncbi:YbjQ family protein [Aeromonas allosaccharophila]